jgi:hypothetical protein
MKKLYFFLAGLFCLTVADAQVINFPDPIFKEWLLQSTSANGYAYNLNGQAFAVDANHNGQIEVSEAHNVKSLFIWNYYDYSNSTYYDISDLTGIANFNSLQVLYLHQNQITTFDLIGLGALKKLYIYDNPLTELDLTGLSNLEDFHLESNPLSVLNFIGATGLKKLHIYNSNLANLNLSGLPILEDIYLSSNPISSLNLTGTIGIKKLTCLSSSLSTLDLATQTNLLEFTFANDSVLTEVDLANCHLLTTLSCYNCPALTHLNVKNGSNEASVGFFSNPALQYICADDSQLANIQSKIATYGYTNCHVNSYCSFTPGGNFYTITGNNRYDSNNSGCDVGDIAASNMKFSIASGAVSGNFIADASGSYAIAVPSGTHTMTPILENPSYFTVSPATASVTFPTDASPAVRDFCLTANGVHNDLEVVVIPISAAGPGFDAIYKIIYKNKGTATQSGSVSLAFNDAVSDFVLAMPLVSSQSANSLLWNFSNLLPFETRSITVTLNLNSPTETPSLQSGDILDYSATVNSALSEETPADNISQLHQAVVNAVDPNDKTCLEGNTVT